MAAPGLLQRVTGKGRFLDIFKIQATFLRNSSNSAVNERSSRIVLTDDGSTILCWHPEETFPYEHSKPIPCFPPEMNETDSVLKVQHRLLHKYRNTPDGPTIPELQKLTFTAKYGWYPPNAIKERNRRPHVRKERDFL